MTEGEVLSKFGLVPKESDVTAVRALLEQELGLYTWDRGSDDLIKLLCVQLFALGAVEDSLLIWRAKRAGFDLGVSVDVQLLCGGGLEPTKEFLGTLGTEQASAALECICRSEETGDFAGFDPETYLETFRRHYGVG